MTIKAVIFDIGGVLLTDPLYKEFWQGYPNTSNLKESFGKGELSISEFAKKGAEIMGLSKDEFLKRYTKAYTFVNRIEKTIKIFQDIKTTRYILSDTNPIHLNYLKENFKDVLDLAKKAYFSSEIGTRKTDKETFELLIKEIGIKAEEIVLVDNREDCLIEPKKLGINVILFKTPEQLDKDLKKRGIK